MIVMKFGGSSLESAEAIARAIAIVSAHRGQQPVVVVSAMGKTTDRLLSIARHTAANEGEIALQKLYELEEYHLQVIWELLPAGRSASVSETVSQQVNELTGWVTALALTGAVTPFLSDAVLSFGERISSEIVAAALDAAGIPAQHLDARRLILTDDRHAEATPLVWETYAKIRRAVAQAAKGQVLVLGGFIGASEAGETTTLGRGGSDWTASLVGAAINAEEIQIWTDVDGMLTCDPRLLAGGSRLLSISYAEAAEMARLGAKVLHPASVEPAVRSHIPISIRNSRRPEIQGTRIALHSTPGSRVVKSVTAKAGLALLRIQILDGTADSSKALEETLTKHRACLHSIEISNGAFLAIVDGASDLQEIAEALHERAKVSLVERGAIAGLVGENVKSTPSIAAQALAALAGAQIHATALATGEMSVRFVVPEEELQPAVACLHATFFEFAAAVQQLERETVETVAASASR